MALILKYRKTDILIVFLVNILTNPLLNSIVNFIELSCGRNGRRIVLVLGEVLVLIIEGFIYKYSLDRKKINPFLLSLILNGISLGIGLLLDYFIW